MDFLFFTERYKSEEILPLLSYMEASEDVILLTEDIIENDILNTGFTYTNPKIYRALVVVGPVSSGAEFVDSLTHELHHLVVAMTSNLGLDLESETPAYMVGDTARDLISVICELGCQKCSQSHRRRRRE